MSNKTINTSLNLHSKKEMPVGLSEINIALPYKDPKTDVFTRVNGDFRLRIIAGSERGIPFGIYPRLLMSWVATEAVRTQSPNIELGDSLSQFLCETLDLSCISVRENVHLYDQMQKLFGSLITAQDAMMIEGLENGKLWTPQPPNNAGKWNSSVLLTNEFYKELVDCPVPINLRAYGALRGSPLAVDVYTWIACRMSHTTHKSKPIPWEALMMLFDSGFHATGDFKKAFLQAIKAVAIFFPQVRFEVTPEGFDFQLAE